MALRLLLSWTQTPLSRLVLATLDGNRHTSEPVMVRTPDTYVDGQVLAIDQATDIAYPELTLLPVSRGLAQVAVKTLTPREGIPVGSVYPLVGTDLQTIEDHWGSSPLLIQRAQNQTSLLLASGNSVPLNYYSVVVQPGTSNGTPHRVDFTNQTTVTVIHMLGKHPAIQIFDLAGNTIQAQVVPTTNDRFDVTFTPAATGYLLY